MNKFVLYFSIKKKGMVENEKEKLFFMSYDFFRNVTKCIIPHRSLVTIHSVEYVQQKRM